MQKVRRRFQFDAILDQFGKAGKDFAFSLVELLVVIAVIGILIALLFPALSGAKLRAQQIQCFSNIRQLGLASLNYANDNNRNPQYTHPAFPGGGTWMANLTEDLKSKALLICPSAPLRSPPPKSGNRQGAADQAWVRWTSDAKIMFTGSYGYNGWFYPDFHKYYPRGGAAGSDFSFEGKRATTYASAGLGHRKKMPYWALRRTPRLPRDCSAICPPSAFGVRSWASEMLARKIWLPEEDKLLGTAPDAELAGRWGRTVGSVKARRQFFRRAAFVG